MGEKRGTYKKNYDCEKTCYRGLLTELMLTAGVTTSDGMRQLPGNTVMMRRTLQRMKSEGLVGTIDLEYGKMGAYLLPSTSFVPEYFSIKIGYYSYYKLLVESKIQTIKRRNRSDVRITTSDRYLNSSDVIHMMYGAGIPVLWADKPSVTPQVYPKAKVDGTGRINVSILPLKRGRGPAYYTASELKYEALKDDNPASKSIKLYNELEDDTTLKAASRTIGVLMGDKEFYPVFCSKTPIMWQPLVESQQQADYSQIMSRWGYPFKSEKLPCIFFARTNSVARQMLYAEPMGKQKKGKQKTVLTCENIDKFNRIPYSTIYMIPYCKEAQNLVLKMTRPDWKEAIRKEVLGNAPYPKGMVNSYDLLDGNTYVLNYCVPDLTKLYRFINIIRPLKDKSRATVICYDWQKEMLEEALKGPVDIHGKAEPIECKIEVVDEKMLKKGEYKYKNRTKTKKEDAV